jgi:hypothetical protein
VLDDTPIALTLWSKMLWSTVSNAFVKSRNTAPQSLPSLCTAVALDEARERTSVSWMHNPCSGHVDSSQIWGPASDWTVLDLNNL